MTDHPPAAGPPHAPVIDLVMGSWVAQALCTATELGIPDVLAAGPATAADVAARTGALPDVVHRLLRALAPAGYVTTGEGGTSLTPLGRTLVTGHPTAARDLVLTLRGTMATASLGRLTETATTGRTGVDLAFGESVWSYWDQRPEEAAWFNRTMVSFHGAEPAAVAQAYDLTGASHVVDVAGGVGTLLRTVLLANPHLRGTLFDQPATLEHADLDGVADRCECVGGDFFASVPAGADVYLLSHVVHDWDEASCATILARCREALPPDGRLLLVEMVLPEGDEPHPGKDLDLIMLSLTGGRERTGEEYRDLLARNGLQMGRIVPTASAASVIEARLPTPGSPAAR